VVQIDEVGDKQGTDGGESARFTAVQLAASLPLPWLASSQVLGAHLPLEPSVDTVERIAQPERPVPKLQINYLVSWKREGDRRVGSAL
jgi:hypothetical protein